jgi:hypothetical protein
MEQDVSFEQDIHPLFRERDIRSMSFAFDLSSYDDVRNKRRGDLRQAREWHDALRRRLARRRRESLPRVDRRRLTGLARMEISSAPRPTWRARFSTAGIDARSFSRGAREPNEGVHGGTGVSPASPLG